jgi:hypothetical protein
MRLPTKLTVSVLCLLLNMSLTTEVLGSNTTEAKTLASVVPQEKITKPLEKSIPITNEKLKEGSNIVPGEKAPIAKGIDEKALLEKAKGKEKSKISSPKGQQDKTLKSVDNKKKSELVAKNNQEGLRDSEKTVATSKEATRSPIAGHKGWFLGIRGAYVRSGILELGYEFNDTFKLRLLGQIGHYNRTYTRDGQRYDRVRIKPQKVGLMIDWHLWKNGLRLSGGLGYNFDRIHLSQAIVGTLLGQPANVYGTISAKYKYRRALAPYLGIGYDTGSLGNSGISISADAGLWFQGKVVSRVNLTGMGQNNATVLETAKVHTMNLINKNKSLKNVPMVSLGIRYLF